MYGLSFKPARTLSAEESPDDLDKNHQGIPQNGTLVSVEVGGEVYLENQTALEYVITNGTASFTELAKSEILTNSF